MNLKDCVKKVRQLDPADKEVFKAEFKALTEGGIPAEEAYAEAAQVVMEQIVAERNQLVDMINAAGGSAQKITLENLLNPASYKPAPTGQISDMMNMSTDDFSAMLDEIAPDPVTPEETVEAPASPEPADPKASSLVKEGSPRLYNQAALEGLKNKYGKDWRQKVKKRELMDIAKDLAEQTNNTWWKNRSKMTKAEMATTLEALAETEMKQALPNPDKTKQLMIEEYTNADSFVGIQVNSEDPAIGAWAQYYGASVEKKATKYDGTKTEKGYHFKDYASFEKFHKAFTGDTWVEGAQNTGSPRSAVDEFDYNMGDKVKIATEGYEGITGTIASIEEDPSDGRQLYYVQFEDPDTGILYDEAFDGTNLLPAKRPDTTASEDFKQALKSGWDAADEGLMGMVELFGGKGKFNSGFTFDEETYKKAKPHFKKSLEHAIQSGQSLKQWAKKVLDYWGQGLKPYMVQLHQDIINGEIEIKGLNDVQFGTPSETADSAVGTEPGSEADAADAGTAAPESTGPAAVDAAQEQGASESRVGVPDDSTADVGTESIADIVEPTGEFPAEQRPETDRDSGTSTETGDSGVSVKRATTESINADAREAERRTKLEPATSDFVAGNTQNVRESLPWLFEEQQDDVVFAEERLNINGGRGVMFTNGTGTGKTFTGLGVIKRFQMQGKDNVIIVVPGEKVANDWIDSGKVLGLNITKLKSTKDAGTGIVVTTYANLADNDAIANRQWDLIVPDEAHKLMENEAGEPTQALKKVRAISGHPRGRYTYAVSMEPELMEKIGAAEAEYNLYEYEEKSEFWSKSKTPEIRDVARKLGLPGHTQAKRDELQTMLLKHRDKLINKHVDYAARQRVLDKQLSEMWATFYTRKKQIHDPNREALWESMGTRRLDLSATPFAWEKNVDHAEGFLFDYDYTKEGHGYNEPDGYQSFMIEHFGYRMHVNKLTAPEAEVDSGLMQREFNSWLKETGVLRGRRLTVDKDYSREFVAIDDMIGEKIDEGQRIIEERSRANADQGIDQNLADGYADLWEAMRRHFNFNERVKMLEAIKASHAVERARKHIELGRKVVLFHSRIQGGTINPFKLLEDLKFDAGYVGKAARHMIGTNPELLELKINETRPLDLFAEEFGDMMTTYNGTITNKAKVQNPRDFQNDEKEIQVIAVQDEGGKEGISLHDQTGASQRVLINLGLPFKPTQAIQIEGRIYRVGQQSDAIFEYFNTGTTFERITFAEKVSTRSGAAENLAMGEEARTLKDSFIDAFENPTTEDPSLGQGKGGKEFDRRAEGATSGFDRAKTHYYGTMKNKKKRGQREGFEYFPTPEPIGYKMVEWANMKPNESVMEPSVGHGAIGRYFPESTRNTFLDKSGELLSKAQLRSQGTFRHMNFEDLEVGANKQHAIVMNPPWGRGGDVAVPHLQKAMHHLKPGGRIVAFMPEGPGADPRMEKLLYGKEGEIEQLKTQIKAKRKKMESVAALNQRLKELTEFHLIADISMPPVTFERAGTAARGRIVVIDHVPQGHPVPQQKPRQELHADTAEELFDRIEHMTMPDRTDIVSREDFFAQHDLEIIQDPDIKDTWLVTGKGTFAHRQDIKNAATLMDEATYWDGMNKAWGFESDPTEALYKAMTDETVAEQVQKIVNEAKVDPRDIPRDVPVARNLWEPPVEQEYKSTDASINRNRPAATLKKVKDTDGWKRGTVNADIGGGIHDITSDMMGELGVDNVVYDPWNRSDEHNRGAIAKIANGQADTATIANTLNVIKESQNRRQVLDQAMNALKPGGKVYIQIYEGDGTGKGRHTKGDIWQENRKASDFLEEIQAVFPDAKIQSGMITGTKTIVAEKPMEQRKEEMMNAARAALAARQPLGGLKITKTTTNKGNEVWEVTGVTKENEKMRTLLKSLGGRWYGPKKAWSFYKGDPSEKIAEALKKDTPAEMKGPRNNGASVGQVNKWIKRSKNRLKLRGMKMRTVDRVSDVGVLVGPDGREFPIDPQAAGVTFMDEIILFAENIPDRATAIKALTHEAVGHMGVEQMLGRKKFDELVDDIYNMVLDNQINPDTHPQLQTILAEVDYHYGKQDKRQQAREVLAHIAHQRPRVGPLVEVWEKLVNWFRQAVLTKFGYDPDYARLESLITRASGYMGDPNNYYTPGGRDPAEMRVWHVSPTAFEEFESRAIYTGKGTGQQNYGFGHYFAGLQDAASYFQRLFSLEGRDSNLYEVWIDPEQTELVHWQDEYSRQPSKIRDAFSILLEQNQQMMDAIDMTGGALYRRAEREVINNSAIGQRIKATAETYGMDAETMRPDHVVSMALHQLGVRGVKFIEKYDSRHGGFNYVIFSDQDVSILSRNNEPQVDYEIPAEMRNQLDPKEKERLEKLGMIRKPNKLERAMQAITDNVIGGALRDLSHRAHEGIFDGLLAIKRLEDQMGIGIGGGDYSGSGYVSMRMATGVSDMMTHLLRYGSLQWRDGVLQGVEDSEGFLDIMGRLGDKQDDWLIWMAGNRANELASQDREKNLDASDIEWAIGKGKGNEQLFNEVKELYNDMNNNMLRLAEDAGLIDPEKRREWESEWYVPFYRQSEEEFSGPARKRGFSHQDAGIRYLVGRNAPTQDLLENVMTNWLKLMDSSVKNHAMRNMVDNFKDTDVLTPESLQLQKVMVPKTEIMRRIRQEEDFALQVAQHLGFTDDMLQSMDDLYTEMDMIREIMKMSDSQAFELMWSVKYSNDPDVVRVKRNGKSEYYRVSSEHKGVLRAVGAMDNLSKQNIGMKAGRMFKRILTTGVTASPDFMLRNFIRDAAHAWAINKDKNFYFAASSLTGLKDSLDDSPAYQAMMAGGASFQGGYIHGIDPEASTDAIRRELERRGMSREAAQGHVNTIINSPKKLAHAVETYWEKYRNVGDKIENANRLATFKAALAEGKPMAQALFEAKDLMDYSRRGNFEALIFFTDLVPFLNARLQGLEKLGRASTENATWRTLGINKTMWRKGFSIMAFSILLAMLNDDDERYQELPDWEKDAYWHVFPGEDHWRIPKPFEIGIITGTIPERMFRAWVTESQPNEKVLWSLQHNLLQTMNLNLIPQAIKPLIEAGFNHSFFRDSPIETWSDRQVIPEERYSETTSATARKLGEWTGTSPKMMQHLWDSYTGTMGVYMREGLDLMVRPLAGYSEKPERQPYQYPLARSIYQGDRVKRTQWETDFYDRFNEVMEIADTVRKFAEEGRDYEAFLDEGDNRAKYQYHKAYRNVNAAFSKLRNERKIILTDDTLTPREKHEQSKAVQLKINALAKEIEMISREGFVD